MEKQLLLTIKTPSSFSKHDELMLNDVLAVLLEQRGLELTKCMSLASNIFIFDDELIINAENGCTSINGYLWATDVLVNRLKDSVQSLHTSGEFDSIENINFYADYDLFHGKLELYSMYSYFDNSNLPRSREQRLPTTLTEKEEIAALMDIYCHETYHMNVLAFLNDSRMHEGLPALEFAAKIHSGIVENIDSLITKRSQHRCAQLPKKETAHDFSL